MVYQALEIKREFSLDRLWVDQAVSPAATADAVAATNPVGVLEPGATAGHADGAVPNPEDAPGGGGGDGGPRAPAAPEGMMRQLLTPQQQNGVTTQALQKQLAAADEAATAAAPAPTHSGRTHGPTRGRVLPEVSQAGGLLVQQQQQEQPLPGPPSPQSITHAGGVSKRSQKKPQAATASCEYGRPDVLPGEERRREAAKRQVDV